MAGPPGPSPSPPPTPSGGGLITYSDETCATFEQCFEVGATVYFNGQITSKYARTATILARVYDNVGTLVVTVINNATASLPANSVYDLKDDLGAGVAYSIDTTGLLPGIYFLDIRISGTDLPTISDLETFKVVAVPAGSPSITSPAITPASIDQSGSASITATFANTTYAWVDFIDEAGGVAHSQEMTITDGAGVCTVRGSHLPAAVYSAGQIIIHAVDSTGALAARDATLALTVTAGDSSYQMLVAQALRDRLRDSAALAAIPDDDIIIAPHEDVAGQLSHYPAILLVPEGNDPAPFSVNQKLHRPRVWCLIAAQHLMARLDYQDITEPDDVHGWVRTVLDLCEEENEDPDERLGGLVQTIHATRSNPKIVEAKSLYVAFIQIDATVIAK